jgi:hypothetical protein
MGNKCTVDENCLSCEKCLIVKYVKFDSTTFVFLPLHVPHNFVSSCSSTPPVSAGFFNITKGIAFGRSVGLNLASDPDDSFIIRVLLKFKEKEKGR